jgi:hypothetical protein
MKLIKLFDEKNHFVKKMQGIRANIFLPCVFQQTGQKPLEIQKGYIFLVEYGRNK